MNHFQNRKNTNKRRRRGFAKGMAGIFVTGLLVFAVPTISVHATTQGQWTYDEEYDSNVYVDKNGWRFLIGDDKTSDSCTLLSVPDDIQGELKIPTNIRLDSIVRKVGLSSGFVVPKGVNKLYLPDLAPYDEEEGEPYESFLRWFDNFSEDDENALTVYCYQDDYYKKYLEQYSFQVEYLEPSIAEEIGGEEEDNWSYDAKKKSYFYTDEQGFKYSLNTKDDASYDLYAISEDTKGEIEIPTETTIEGKKRKLRNLDGNTLQIPKGVTKVTFGKGITYYEGPIFDKCSPDLVVKGYLAENTDIIQFATNKGIKMEYQNGYTDKNGIVYYLGQPTKSSGTKGKTAVGVYGYKGKTTTLTVASKVTIQGKSYSVTFVNVGAFSGTKVKKVTLPDTITLIGYSAFQDCKALTSVHLPKKLTELGHTAFSGCTSLTGIEIPSGVTSLYTSSFEGCTNLKKVTLSKNMKHIGDYVFSDCKNLTTIQNLDKLESIGSETFARCKKLTTLTFGKKLKSIGMATFYQCTSLKSVTLQSTSMEIIGEMAFYGTSKLKTITIKATNLSAKNLGSNIFKGTGKKMVVKVPAKKVNAYQKLLKKYGNTTIVVKKS